MKRDSKIVIKESTDELRKIYQSNKNTRIKLKIKCLLLFKENRFSKQEKLAEHLCISHATLKRWLSEYNQKGLSFIMEVKSKGKPKSLIDLEIRQALSEKLLESPNAFNGYSAVKKWIFDTYHVDVKYATVRCFMIKHFKSKIRITKTASFLTVKNVV